MPTQPRTDQQGTPLLLGGKGYTMRLFRRLTVPDQFQHAQHQGHKLLGALALLGK